MSEIGTAEQLVERIKGFVCDATGREHVTLATDALAYVKNWGQEQRHQGAQAEHDRLTGMARTAEPPENREVGR